VQERSLRLEEKERQTDNWVLEEPGFRCTIRFDSKSGTLMKKKKTLITD
jgi:hypothetical protein